MDDTLTITFMLAPGKTLKGEGRTALLPVSILWVEAMKIRFDPALEDMGVGNLLDDPNVVAVDVAWVDDYDDTSDPVLTATALYCIDNADHPEATAYSIADSQPRAVNAPYYERGVQIVEWIVQYMTENVYNQDSNEEAN